MPEHCIAVATGQSEGSCPEWVLAHSPPPSTVDLLPVEKKSRDSLKGEILYREFVREESAMLFLPGPSLCICSWGCSSKNPRLRGLSNRNGFSHRSGGQKSKMKVSMGVGSCWGLGGGKEERKEGRMEGEEGGKEDKTLGPES